MSLFQARSLWSTRLGNNEEFDNGHLCMANIDNDANGDLKIITGSFMGYVRIHYPRQRESVPDDLMCELALAGPVLQIAVGRLLSAHENLALAVLQSRKVTVYTATSVNGANGKQEAMTLQRAYEHKLPRNACNMTIGSFGGVYGRDFLCVQSMDGVLSFFEQEASSFSCFLPNTLVPGPMIYVPSIDSFVTATSSLEIECYKFQMLASASVSDKELELGQGKNPQAEWSRTIGEHALEIHTGQVMTQVSGQVDIVVLGEQTLFCLKENGQINSQKRFDDHTACFIPYRTSRVEGQESSNLLVANFSEQLHVYRQSTLIWSARVDAVPVQIGVGSFIGQNGVICTLDSTGRLVLNYLGTDPATATVTASQTGKEVDFSKIDAEQRRLSKLIKEAQASGADQVAAQSSAGRNSGDITLVMQQHEVTSASTGSFNENNPPSVTLKIGLEYTGPEQLDNITVTVSVPPPFQCKHPSVIVNGVGAVQGTKVATFVVDCESADLPTSLEVPVVAVYTLDTGESRTISSTTHLPLRFVVAAVSPVKTVTFKLTIDTNEGPPSLRTIFSDLVVQNSLKDFVQDNVMTLEFADGHDATVVVAKNAGRYRLQGGTFQHLWLLASELTRRLRKHFSANSGFKMTYNDTLPLKDYFEFIDAHFGHRVALKGQAKVLDNRAQQLRAVQRRLLVRFKDRNPPPLKNLDGLLRLTFDQVMDQGTTLQDTQAALRKAAIDLAAATRLMQTLIVCRFQLDAKSAQLLMDALSATVVDAGDIGWEEMTDASMTHLLRTCLARSAKDKSTLAQPLTFPESTQKLKKHITLVVDRLGKGGKLVPGGTSIAPSASGSSGSKPVAGGKALPKPPSAPISALPSAPPPRGPPPAGSLPPL